MKLTDLYNLARKNGMQIAQVHDAVPKKFMSFFHSPRENETRRQMTITYPEASNIAIPEASEGPKIWGVPQQ